MRYIRLNASHENYSDLRSSITSLGSKVCQAVNCQEDTHRSLAAFFTNTKINQKANDGESQNTEGWNLKKRRFSLNLTYDPTYQSQNTACSPTSDIPSLLPTHIEHHGTTHSCSVCTRLSRHCSISTSCLGTCLPLVAVYLRDF